MIIWFTGQPGSGKTTLAKELVRMGICRYLIDGDQLRAVQPEDFDVRGRWANVCRAQDVALYLHKEGENVAAALISPSRAQREWLKDRLGDEIIEVFLHTTETRGRENFFVQTYEAPSSSFVQIDTGIHSVAQSLAIVVEAINAAEDRRRVAK